MAIKEKFPGVVGKVCRAYVLNDEQLAWFRRYYPVNVLSDVEQATGIGTVGLRRLAKRYGVVKDRKAVGKIYGRRISATLRRRQPLKGKKPSAATIEGIRRRWQNIREGKTLNPIQEYQRRHPKKSKEMFKERGKRLSEAYQKEKRRTIYGNERKTNLHIVMTPYTRSQISHKCNALNRGYIVYSDCSEQGGERYNIYYDEQTERSAKFEANCEKVGFTIKKMK